MTIYSYSHYHTVHVERGEDYRPECHVCDGSLPAPEPEEPEETGTVYVEIVPDTSKLEAAFDRLRKWEGL